MFKKIIVKFDENGKLYEKPIEISLKDMNAKTFTVSSDRSSINWDVANIWRSVKNIDKDPYNCDGRPPTLLFKIYNPSIEFCGDWVEITGFEESNLIFSGKILEPYNKGEGIDGVEYSPRSFIEQGRGLVYRNILKPQKILLF